MSYGRWGGGVPKQRSVSARLRDADKHIKQLRKKGEALSPVILDGRRKIATTFWGQAWCDNIEAYQDFAYRLDRGRSYVRHNQVIDLSIHTGYASAQVSGTQIYHTTVRIDPLPPARWASLVTRCSGQIASMVELLQGRFSKPVMALFCDQKDGLFPAPREIHFSCSCPDHASLCKHVAAVLYGIGARLDASPELLFRLRDVDESALLISAGALDDALRPDSSFQDDDLSALFGIEIDTAPPTPASAAAAMPSPSAAAAPSPKTAIPVPPAAPAAASAAARPAPKKATPAAAKPSPSAAAAPSPKTRPAAPAASAAARPATPSVPSPEKAPLAAAAAAPPPLATVALQEELLLVWIAALFGVQRWDELPAFCQESQGWLSRLRPGWETGPLPTPDLLRALSPALRADVVTAWRALLGIISRRYTPINRLRSWLEASAALIPSVRATLSGGRLTLADDDAVVAVLRLLHPKATPVWLGQADPQRAARVAAAGGAYLVPVPDAAAAEVALFFRDAIALDFDDIDHVRAGNAATGVVWVDWVDWIPGREAWPGLSAVILLESHGERWFAFSNGAPTLAERVVGCPPPLADARPTLLLPPAGDALAPFAAAAQDALKQAGKRTLRSQVAWQKTARTSPAALLEVLGVG